MSMHMLTCRCSEKNSATGTRTRVARVRAEYPNQLDYSADSAVGGHLSQII